MTTTKFSKDTAGKWFHDLIQLYCAQPVAVEATIMSHSGRLVIRPSAADMRQVIGKGGENIRALQAITKAVGDSSGLKLDCTLVEPAQCRVTEPMKFVRSEAWNREGIIGTLESLLETLGETNGVKTADFGDGVTIIEVAADFDDELKAAVTTIFRAIGRQHGRYFQLEFL